MVTYSMSYHIIIMCTKDCINWPVASAGVESCLRKQNRVVKKFYPRFLAISFMQVQVLKDILCTVH